MTMLDCVSLEMRMAEIMAQQEASGFRFDLQAADKVKSKLQQEMDDIVTALTSKFLYVPGKVFTPKRSNKKQGHFQWRSNDQAC